MSIHRENMFNLRWLRRIIRRNMTPIHELDAIKWKQRLAVAYAFTAWNALALVVYYFYRGKADWAAYHGLKLEDEINQRPGEYWAEVLGTKKATIYRVQNFRITDTSEYVAPEKSD